MKYKNKLISIIILSALLLSLLYVGSFATQDKIKATLSDDLKTVYYDGQTFICVPDKYVNYMYFEFENQDWNNIEFSFSSLQGTHITDYDVQTYYNEYQELCVLELRLQFSLGSLSLTYINEKIEDDIVELIEGNSDNAVINVFSYYSSQEEDIPTKASTLKSGKAQTLPMISLYSYDHIYVYSVNKTCEILMDLGAILKNSDDETYYYLDYKENGIVSLADVDPYTVTEFKVYEISDTQLISSIDAVFQSEDYTDDFLSEEDLAALAYTCVIFGTFLLCGGSVALGIIFFIKSRKATAPFNKLYRAIVIICGVVFVLTAVLFSMVML